MSRPAIRTEQLGKQYRLGVPGQRYKTMRESLSRAFRPRRWRGSRQRNLIWALRHVTLEVQPGDVLGIIGSNGAGKSTLLKVLSRITEPTEGWAEVRGRVGSLLEVGTGFHPELSGRENIFLSGAILGMKRAEIQRKFDQIVAFAEVDQFVDTALKHYSSGMYLRLAFAVAAHLEPAILMVDEVLAVGDLAFQRKCLGKMQEVGESGQTVLFVSHDLTAIARLAPRAVVMERGQVAFHGPTSDAIDRYAAQRAHASESLEHRTDRTGDGLIRLTALEFARPDGSPAATIDAGAPLLLSIAYRSRLPDLQYEHLALDVMFTDVLGHPITTVSTRFGRYRQSRTLPAAGTLQCLIPSFALASETYKVHLWLAYKGGVADFVAHAGEVRVVPSDFYETGDQPVKRKHGAALLHHEWRMAATDDVGRVHAAIER
jgi:lipopolysaccharide transport system ATP-binding protein